jgi:hypothetical protein
VGKGSNYNPTVTRDSDDGQRLELPYEYQVA